MNSSLLLGISTFGWLFCGILYISNQLFNKPLFKRFSFFALALTFVIHTAGIGLRWKESYDIGIGHAPLSNLYESLVFGAWAVMAVWIFMKIKLKVNSLDFIPSLIASIAMAYASFSPDINSQIQPLIPALKSNWLTIHVITCFLGYAGFSISFGISSLYVAKTRYENLLKTFPELSALERLNHQFIVFGFLWLTVGIITGAVWANSAWGSYWSWDPKETWSLVTWLIYALILHLRFMKNWQGKRIAILSIVGFGFVLFTYLGVNFWLSGLHSYGAK